jgi:hypothetical protein
MVLDDGARSLIGLIRNKLLSKGLPDSELSEND